MKSCYAGFGVGRGFTPAVIPPPVILSEAKNLTCYQTIFLRPDPSLRSRMTPDGVGRKVAVSTNRHSERSEESHLRLS